MITENEIKSRIVYAFINIWGWRKVSDIVVDEIVQLNNNVFFCKYDMIDNDSGYTRKCEYTEVVVLKPDSTVFVTDRNCFYVFNNSSIYFDFDKSDY